MPATSPLPFDPPLTPVIDLRADAPVARLSAPAHGVAVSTVDPSSGSSYLVYVSEGLADLLGTECKALLGRSPAELFAPDLPAEHFEAVGEIVDRGEQAVVDLLLRHRSGHAIPVQASFLALPQAPNSWPQFLATFRDPVAARRGHRIAALDSAVDRLGSDGDLHTMLQAVVAGIEGQIAGARCWIGLSDPAGGIDSVVTTDRVSEETLRSTLDSITESGDGASLGVWIPEALGDEEAVSLPLIELGVAAGWSLDVRGSDDRRLGALVVALDELRPPTPTEEDFLTEAARVVSTAVERTVSAASLAHQALHDPLTELPNRHTMLDRLEAARSRPTGARVGALLVDLDRFKALNDTRGTQIGDRILVEVSRRLRSVVRPGDSVGRVSGDQFLVICVPPDGASPTEEASIAEAMAQRIVETVAEPIDLGDHGDAVVTASVGVVVADPHTSSAADIVNRAESALAEAIATGRSRYASYDQELQARVRQRHELEEALGRAIELGELRTHFQPVIDIRSGLMVGAEALVRWERPGLGLQPPAEFIAVAEESGQIVEIGAWVIDDVCRQLAHWPLASDGRHPVVTVNLSARQLADVGLVDTVQQALARHGVEPRRIGFEITESMRVDDLEFADRTLRALAALGCRLAIDDFGIGYATLDYLRRFSLAHALKIDRSFVSGLGESREDTAIVNASVALATGLGMQVVGEGVETTGQLRHLAALGCHLAQGYVIGKPMPGGDAAAAWERARLMPPVHELTD